jgi:hypothetical protein
MYLIVWSLVWGKLMRFQLQQRFWPLLPFARLPLLELFGQSHGAVHDLSPRWSSVTESQCSALNLALYLLHQVGIGQAELAPFSQR